ncbi:MAG: hypothetical protein A2268_03875 [Candidatus Raymondbacteria bacterium RifOxyA12_full_50_37]|uniref:Rhamnogalacturonase A/B/Epimerase-like pectate lyase domain-containing protein n=1 Tax=Candidatus Raymondbacteria bacterium RIFOXYD12_FULL_49_13 TaxID=1817890 RepID=A0A1F7FAR4_UNCRA
MGMTLNNSIPAWGISVRECGASGNGTTDDGPAFEKALAKHTGPVVVPPGFYKIAKSIRLPSGTRIMAHPEARMFFADGTGIDSHSFLLTNSDHENGNQDIAVEGGIWDGNNLGNPRGPDAPNSYTGVLVNFKKVQNLTLLNMTLKDPESYNIRFCEVRNFRVENISLFTTRTRPNQDGVHVGGGCEDGFIRNIAGFGRMTPNDDLVPLVADDALNRAQNIGKANGPVRRITILDLKADDCHSFLRLASVWNPIEDVVASGVHGGCQNCAVNCDALRYCRVPVFDPAKPPFPDGAGLLSNIRLSDFEIYRTLGTDGDGPSLNPLLLLETRMRNFSIERFYRVQNKDAVPDAPTLRIRNTAVTGLSIEGLSVEDLKQDTRISPSVCMEQQRMATSTNTEAFRLALNFQIHDEITSRCAKFKALRITG